jgi:hypothetical protein
MLNDYIAFMGSFKVMVHPFTIIGGIVVIALLGILRKRFR